MPDSEKVCLLNPNDGALMTRVNRMAGWDDFTTRRAETNALTYDKALDMTDAFMARSMALTFHLANIAALTSTESADTDNEVANDTEDTAMEGIATANQAVATSIANLASALVPIIAGTSGVVSVQTLAAVLAAVVGAAGTAANAAASPAK